jgi:integrase/recombinase XerD
MQDFIISSSNLDITIYSEDEKKNMVWAKAFQAWIDHFSSQSTIRSYSESWKYFLQYSQKPPWKVGRSTVVDYMNYMREQGLAESTIQVRLAGLSSFYDFVCKDYTIINSEDREVPLYDLNPCNGKVLRRKLEPYSKSNYLKVDEIKQFLAVIDRSKIQGMRDYSLFLMFFMTGRRNSEVRNLKWGDITVEDGYILYRWSGKYVQYEKTELPKNVYDSMVEYLKFSKRLETIKPEDHVYVGVNDNEKRLPNIKKDKEIVKSGEETEVNKTHPLSMREIGKLIHKYCKLSQIDKEISCHSLRHSAALMRRKLGATFEEVSAFLVHANFQTTNVYLNHMEGTRDRLWKKAEKKLSL